MSMWTPRQRRKLHWLPQMCTISSWRLVHLTCSASVFWTSVPMSDKLPRFCQLTHANEFHSTLPHCLSCALHGNEALSFTLFRMFCTLPSDCSHLKRECQQSVLAATLCPLSRDQQSSELMSMLHSCSCEINPGCLTTCFDLQNAQLLENEIIYDRDFHYDYFGFKVGMFTGQTWW